MSFTRKAISLCAVVLLSATSTFASERTYFAQFKNQQLQVADSGKVTFRSGEQTLVMEPVSGGMRFGSLELRVERKLSESGPIHYLINAQFSGRTVVSHIFINERTRQMTRRNGAALDALLKEFAATAEGQLLQEARRFIVSDVFNTPEEELARGTTGNLDEFHAANFSPWDCGGSVLNGVAAGAAMAAGCGAGGLWCVSGVAWYGSALIDIADGCVFM